MLSIVSTRAGISFSSLQEVRKIRVAMKMGTTCFKGLFPFGDAAPVAVRFFERPDQSQHLGFGHVR